jgi:hypothetical protein
LLSLFGRTREIAAFLELQSPVVLMGRGHSGTRVLAFACAHLGLQLGVSEGLATGDADDRAFTDSVKDLCLRTFGATHPSEIRPRHLRAFQQAVHGYYVRLGSPRGLWGWKFPETYLVAPLVARAFPRARYVHLVRDGRDIAFKEHLTDNPRRKLGKRILSRRDALGLPRFLQAAHSWSYQVDAFDDFRRAVAPEQVHDLRFEDLCLEPEATIEGLCRFLDVSFTAECRAYLRDHVDTKKVAQYRENDLGERRQVEAAVAGTLERYGYLP